MLKTANAFPWPVRPIKGWGFWFALAGQGQGLPLLRTPRHSGRAPPGAPACHCPGPTSGKSSKTKQKSRNPFGSATAQLCKENPKEPPRSCGTPVLQRGHPAALPLGPGHARVRPGPPAGVEPRPLPRPPLTQGTWGTPAQEGRAKQLRTPMLGQAHHLPHLCCSPW